MAAKQANFCGWAMLDSPRARQDVLCLHGMLMIEGSTYGGMPSNSSRKHRVCGPFPMLGMSQRSESTRSYPKPFRIQMAPAQLGRRREKCIHEPVIDQKYVRRPSAVDMKLPWHIYTMTAEPRDLDVKAVSRCASAMCPNSIHSRMKDLPDAQASVLDFVHDVAPAECLDLRSARAAFALGAPPVPQKRKVCLRSRSPLWTIFRKWGESEERSRQG